MAGFEVTPDRLATILGLLTLALSVMGVYGLMSFAVPQRIHEIGVRVALGAQRWQILRLALWEGIRLALLGTIIGALGAAGVSISGRFMLYGLSPVDPLTFGGVSLLLLIVSLLACWHPASQATKVDPVVALRYE